VPEQQKSKTTLPSINTRRPSWYLETHGWSRGAAVRNKERVPVQLNSTRQASYCMHGAIRIAEYNKAISAIDVGLLQAALVRLLGRHAMSRKDEIATIIHWNDEVCSFSRAAVELMKVAERLALDSETYEDTLVWAISQSFGQDCQERLECVLESNEAKVLEPA